MTQNNSCSKCGRVINKKGPLTLHENKCNGTNNQPSFKASDVSRLLEDNTFQCLSCNECFATKHSFVSHYWLHHSEKGNRHLEKILDTVDKLHKDRIGKIPWNKGLTKETDQRIDKSAKLIKSKFERGIIKPSQLGRKMTIEHKEKLSHARSSFLATKGSGGYSTVGWYEYVTLNGNKYTLRGTWEVKVAEWLDKNGVGWSKDMLLKYSKDNIKRTYVPDFYVASKNTVLEVKGYFSDKDKDKMKLVSEQHTEIKFVMLFEEQIKDLDISLSFLLDNSNKNV